jgi:hypothetical protein
VRRRGQPAVTPQQRSTNALVWREIGCWPAGTRHWQARATLRVQFRLVRPGPGVVRISSGIGRDWRLYGLEAVGRVHSSCFDPPKQNIGKREQ